MIALTPLLVCILFLLGASELALAVKKGVPGRRVGGGTRYELPKQSVFTLIQGGRREQNPGTRSQEPGARD
jgi:hypothetical protein